VNIIYQPKGRAREYAGLALNPYSGCTHGCKYCFNQDAPFVKARMAGGGSDFFAGPEPKSDVLIKVRRDAAKLARIYKLASNPCPEILVSFVGDPYQPAEIDLKLTRNIIKILIQHDLPFTILTKGGLRAIRDFYLIKDYPKASFGTTLTLNRAADCAYWEPNAADYWVRVETIRLAKKVGIKTWVSLEPVIIPDQALRIVRECHEFVDHWKVGKINHDPDIEQKHDWLQFRTDAVALLDSLGADYYLKKSLTEL